MEKYKDYNANAGSDTINIVFVDDNTQCYVEILWSCSGLCKLWFFLGLTFQGWVTNYGDKDYICIV
jgi:hypothetical protein